MSLLLQQIPLKHIKMGLIISIYYLSNLSKQGSLIVFFFFRDKAGLASSLKEHTVWPHVTKIVAWFKFPLIVLQFFL